MLRNKFIEGKIGKEKYFRWRGGEVSRVEGLGDAVFAFAITLLIVSLIVSLEVPHTFNQLMIVYSLGFFMIFFVLFLIYLHAYRKRNKLELDDIETIITKNSLYEQIIYMGVASLSILLTLPGKVELAPWSGICHILLGPLMTINGYLSEKR